MASNALKWDRSTRRLFVGYATDGDEIWFSMDAGCLDFKDDTLPIIVRPVRYKSTYYKLPMGGAAAEEDIYTLGVNVLADGIVQTHKSVAADIEAMWMAEYKGWIEKREGEMVAQEAERVKNFKKQMVEELIENHDFSTLDEDERVFYSVDEALAPEVEAEVEIRIAAHLTCMYGLDPPVPVDVVHEMRLAVWYSKGERPAWKSGAWQHYLWSTGHNTISRKWTREEGWVGGCGGEKKAAASDHSEGNEGRDR